MLRIQVLTCFFQAGGKHAKAAAVVMEKGEKGEGKGRCRDTTPFLSVPAFFRCNYCALSLHLRGLIASSPWNVSEVPRGILLLHPAVLGHGTLHPNIGIVGSPCAMVMILLVLVSSAL